jgi:hypothetical protein
MPMSGRGRRASASERDKMQGEVFEATGDEPLYVINMGDGYGVISQDDGNGRCESIAADSQRLRAMADYLDRATKNTDRAKRDAA